MKNLFAIFKNKSVGEYFDIGNEKYDKSDYMGAIVYYNKAIEINPNYASAYYCRGNSKIELSDKMGACLDWKKAVELGELYANDLIKKYCQ